MKLSHIKELVQATASHQVSGLPTEILDQIPSEAAILLDIAPFAMTEEAIEELIRKFDPEFRFREANVVDDLLARIEAVEEEIEILKQGGFRDYERPIEERAFFPFAPSPPEGPDSDQ